MIKPIIRNLILFIFFFLLFSSLTSFIFSLILFVIFIMLFTSLSLNFFPDNSAYFCKDSQATEILTLLHHKRKVKGLPLSSLF